MSLLSSDYVGALFFKFYSQFLSDILKSVENQIKALMLVTLEYQNVQKMLSFKRDSIQTTFKVNGEFDFRTNFGCTGKNFYRPLEF